MTVEPEADGAGRPHAGADAPAPTSEVEPRAPETPGNPPAGKAGLYWQLARPFTLLAPAVGMVSGAVMELGASGGLRLSAMTLVRLASGAVLAILLNAASNSLNQIYDLEGDRINKPGRPLPRGALTVREAWWFVLACGGGALGLAAALSWQCFLVVLLGALAAWAYSAPPLRTKRHWLLSNLTIATARGLLLIVAGWAVTGNVFVGPGWWEPWLVGGLFGLFLLGAASTKDFSDIPGDRAMGCVTLPIRFGMENAAALMLPSFVLPFLLLILAAQKGWIGADRTLATLLGGVLAVWGGYVAYLVGRRPEELARENHPSWGHMYLML
jgi:4-hydroxybenzoate polyprenyltransferase